jgi:hypothetical protein
MPAAAVRRWFIRYASLLDEYLAAAGIAGDPEGPLFRTTGRKTGQAQAMWQQVGGDAAASAWSGHFWPRL